MRGAIEITNNPDTTPSTASGGASSNASEQNIKSQIVGTRLCLLLILLATIIAYSPILFDFFAGDDFVHLTWLKTAVQHPEMIWRNFHASWLDGTTTKFYRPLISIFMVTDYLAWGINGLGYHLTNLFFHCASSLFLFFIVRDLANAGKTEKEPDNFLAPANLWALTACAVFALYPLHPEAVSWITGRVDDIVTTFCVGALWCYMRWRAGAGPLWCAGAITSFICGLLSKEMAITIPALFVAYEFIMQPASANKPAVSSTPGGNAVVSWFKSGLVSSLWTLPFWALLVGYFIVRRIALGTFVGGYDDSLLFIADPQAFVLNWLHAVRVFIEPLNRDLIGSRSTLTRTWEAFLIAGTSFGIFRLVKERHFKALLFTCAWMVFSLAPVYKLFAIADDLQGSRLAYLATVPLSIIFGYCLSGCALLPFKKVAARLQWVVPTAFAILCATALYINNGAWRSAGLEANAIRTSLSGIYEFINSDPQIMFIGLPDHIAGAYVTRNALYGMSKNPQICFDAYNNIMVNEFEAVFPFGFLKDSMSQSKDVFVFHWSKEQQKFAFVKIPKDNLSSPVVFSGEQLKDLPNLKGGDGTYSAFDGDRFLQVAATKATRPEITFDLPTTLSPWSIDFVAVDVFVNEAGVSPVGADLLYANEGNPKFMLARRTHAPVDAAGGKQRWLFALHSLPEWSLGGGQARFKLLTPPQSKLRIESISVVPTAQLMPKLNFVNSGYTGTKGYLHLTPKTQTESLTVDATGVPGAKTTLLEVTRANMFFEEQNCTNMSKIQSRTISAPAKGSVLLNKRDFPADGLYELRAWAIDEHGKKLGLSSDHICVSIDP